MSTAFVPGTLFSLLTNTTCMTETILSDTIDLAQAHRLLLEWYERSGRDLPWRNINDPYAVLVSEMMLQQTQVDRVLPKYREFLSRFPTLAALAEAPTADVIRAWAPLGYNMRAVRLQSIARQVMAEYGGQIPLQVAELSRLKGVGRYTAGAIACFAHRQQVATVDTNIRRVLYRVFVGIEQPDAPVREEQSWALAEKVLPLGQAYQWNQALMDLGATICTATTPACERCPMQTICRAYQKLGQYTLFPSGEGLRMLLQQRKAASAVQKRAGGTVDADASGQMQPGGVLRKVAEAPAIYKTQPFTSTNRYFRGRVVDALRALGPGERMALADLGPQVKAGFAPADLPWLVRLVQGLARDGLIALHPATAAGGDGNEREQEAMQVSLP
jgi:A/G-specific adenine glycosylase